MGIAEPKHSKRTVFGSIPADWKLTRFSDLKPFVTSGSRGWARFYSDDGSLFIRITNLSRADIHLDLHDLRVVTIAPDDPEALRTAVRDGDVLISITADIGIIGHVSEAVPKPAFINQHIALVRWDPKLADSLFVSYFLASSGPQRVFRARTDAGAKAGMNLATVANIEFALPSEREQRAIAAALGDTDSLIHCLEELLAKKRQIKEGAMQELLTGKRRLPGFSRPWEDMSLFELAGRDKRRFDDGDWVEAVHMAPHGARLVQTGNIGINEFVEADAKRYVSNETFQELNCKEVFPGDLLICRLADPAGRCCVMPDIAESKMLTSVDVTIFRPLAQLANRDFIAHLSELVVAS